MTRTGVSVRTSRAATLAGSGEKTYDKAVAGKVGPSAVRPGRRDLGLEVRGHPGPALQSRARLNLDWVVRVTRVGGTRGPRLRCPTRLLHALLLARPSCCAIIARRARVVAGGRVGPRQAAAVCPALEQAVPQYEAGQAESSAFVLHQPSAERVCEGGGFREQMQPEATEGFAAERQRGPRRVQRPYQGEQIAHLHAHAHAHAHVHAHARAHVHAHAHAHAPTRNWTDMHARISIHVRHAISVANAHPHTRN